MHMKISLYIKKIRKNLHLTQKQLADLLGTKRYNIAKYETDKAMPSGDFVLNLQKLFEKMKR